MVRLNSYAVQLINKIALQILRKTKTTKKKNAHKDCIKQCTAWNSVLFMLLYAIFANLFCYISQSGALLMLFCL